jgi:outer membrane receptor for ferrienterochelin and colicins
VVLCLFALPSLAQSDGGVSADEPSSPPEDAADYFLNLNVELFKLGSSLTDSVTSVTKTEQRGAQTPAVITVVTRDEIIAQGYGSLAEVLRSVPGFYDVYDLVSHNIGVRGVNGGARASGSVLKLMIDGMPVDFRSTTGNEFGEALIPMHLIERIEIIRGPASALYGANAFLGVVNVIPVSGERFQGVRALVRGALVRSNLGGGFGAHAGGSTDRFDFLVGVEGSYLDRSGLTLPASSPVLTDEAIQFGTNDRSARDTSTPKTFLGQLKVKRIWGGELSVLTSLQRSDASGEFQDISTLTHNTRISVLNQNYRLKYEIRPSGQFSWQLSGSYLQGEPTSSDRLDVGRADHILERELAVHGYGVQTEARYSPSSLLAVTGGADYTRENHFLLSYGKRFTKDITAQDGAVLVSAGSYEPGAGYRQTHVFQNAGAFLQVTSELSSRWSTVLGSRVDWHSAYGTNISPRAGVVFAPGDWSFKLLYGSSFKAPSATQLYGQTAGVYTDLVGNKDLKAQRAHTVELAGGYSLPKKRGEILVNTYLSSVLGRVEYVQFGTLSIAKNMIDEVVVGGELDARYNLTDPFRLRWTLGVAKTVNSISGALVAVQVENPLFPVFQTHLIADYDLFRFGVRLSAEVSYISARASSQPNAQYKTEAYAVPGYVYTAVSVAMPEKKLFGDRTTQVSLRVSDLFNQRRAEPGFGGVDVPTQGITTLLTIVQSL